MPTKGKIDSGKILVKEIFDNYWFNIPVYQRPYVWESDQIDDLLDDLTFAIEQNPNDPDFEYFSGSFVFQSKPAGSEAGQKYRVNDLLDGQQRMTTLLMLFAVIRDLVEGDKEKKVCQDCIFQQEVELKRIPEQTRITYATHPKVTKFIKEYIKEEAGTKKRDRLIEASKNSEDPSVKNMANAVLEMHKFFSENPNANLVRFLDFLLNNVLFIYVSTEDLEDAFRLFQVLNNRGVQLEASDILKAMNLKDLEPEEQINYAKMWENAEGELTREGFERFLNHLRTILVKDKARSGLVGEFTQKIYATQKLHLGQDTFKLIEEYLDIYNTLLDDVRSYDRFGNHEFGNLMNVMLKGLLGTDWIPPLLCYFKHFGYGDGVILDFLKKLDIKYSADWIGRRSPTDRIMAMIEVIKVIEAAKNVEEVINSKCFDIDAGSFIDEIKGPIYGKRFARYLLLKLDHLYNDKYLRLNVENLSVEHILPQTPANGSGWVTNFSQEERDEWTHRVGNLVLITGSKNRELGRKDYKEKVETYFKERIDTIPLTLHVLNHNRDEWTPTKLKENHQAALKKICDYYGIIQTDVLEKMIASQV